MTSLSKYHSDQALHLTEMISVVDTGARYIENILTRILLPEMAS